MARKRKQGSECFYLDANGKRQDAEIHEEILAGSDGRAAKEVSLRFIVDVLGFPEERARKALGL
jgi:hypothetical protein